MSKAGTRAAWAARYIGIPWAEDGGNYTPEGTHCYGLYWLVNLQEFDRRFPTYNGNYATDDDLTEANALIEDRLPQHYVEVPEAEVEKGDAVIYRWAGRNHVGIVVGDREFLTIRRGVNAYIERWDRKVWQRARVGFFRWTG